MSIYSIDKLMTEARRLAIEYRQATGKNLPITAEIAINDAVRLLSMQPVEKTGLGYDAIYSYEGMDLKVQIKGRAIINENAKRHRIGQIKTELDWDGVILVLMNKNYEPESIHLARRHDIENSCLLYKTNKRGALSVAKFKSISELIWQCDNVTSMSSESVGEMG